jgi:dolichol-phosphate mannosyltransferase
MTVSVVLPTYNELENIVPLVRAVLDRLPPGGPHQVLVVDDNSPDGTHRAVREIFAGDTRVVPILRTADRGLAKSIRAGIEASHGERIVILDTDFTHDPAEIPRILHLLEISDIAVGSRFCAGGAMEDVPHYLCSLIYNWFARIVLRTQIQDNLSGYLGLRRTALEGLPYDRIFYGYGEYCFRLLHYTQRAGCRILELPVHYTTRQKGASKSQFMKLLFSYTYALLRLRLDILREPPRPQASQPAPPGVGDRGAR